MPDITGGSRELRRAMAKASLRRNWKLAEASPVKVSDEGIEREIETIRAARLRRIAKWRKSLRSD